MMDPNANLEKQKEIFQWLEEYETWGDLQKADCAETRINQLEHAVELAQDLYEWLEKGGFKPDAWR